MSTAQRPFGALGWVMPWDSTGKVLTKQIANLAREKQLKKAQEVFQQFE